MLASQIITDVRRDLLETTAAYWSDAELLRHINRAEADYVNRTRILEDSAQLSLVQGRLDYPLPSNWLSAKLVLLKLVQNDGTYSWRRLYPSNLEKVAQRRPNFLNTTAEQQGQPDKYWIWAKNLWLDRAPDSEHTTQLALFFKSKPIPLASTSDSINIDDSLAEAITAYVLELAWRKEQEYDRANEQRTTYDRYVAEGRKWVKRQSGDQRYRLDIDSPLSLDGSLSPFGPLAD